MRLDRQQAQRPREAGDDGLVKRPLLDHELCVRRDRIHGRAALDAPDVRARLAPRGAAQPPRDPADLVDRARAPPVGPGVAARALHADTGAQAPDRIHGDMHEAMALESDRQLRLQVCAGRARAGEVAESLLAHRERDREPLQAARAPSPPRPGRRTRRPRRCRRHRGRARAPPRAPARAAARARTPCPRARAAARAGAPRRSARSGCRLRPRPAGPARPAGAAGATRCAHPRRTSAPARAPARAGLRGHRPRRSRRADAISKALLEGLTE